MKLVHKCLIFCLIVLGAQIGTFVVLAFEVLDSQRAVARISYSNKVMSYTTEVVENLQEAIFCLSSQVVTRSPQSGVRFKAIADNLPRLSDELQGENLASPEDKADIQAIAKSARFVTDALKGIEDEILASGSPTNLAKYFTVINLGIKPHVADIMDLAGRLSERHSARHEDSGALQEKINELVRWMIITGFGTSVVATIATVIGFNKVIATRIGIIADNFGRMASGSKLNPRQEGNDEISKLDHQFHNLTSALASMMENERELFHNMPVGLVTFDQSGKIEAANPCAESMLGRSAETLRGSRLSSILTEQSDIAYPFSQPQREPFRVQFKRADGSVFPAEIIASAYQHKNELKSVVSILDISAREEVNKLKEEFISIVGHDIRAPLSSIDACLSLITSGAFGNLPEDGLTQVKSGREQCSRLFRLTSELLDMARVDSGKMVVNTSECAVSQLIATAVAIFDFDANKKNIEFVTEPSDLTVLADKDRTVQILQNFVANAVKFSPEGKQIHVFSVKDDNAVKICVKDEGPGIDTDVVPQLFQRFKQVRDEDQRRGTGLGLAICKMMAECQGGTVGVDTADGTGSTFWVRLPSK